MMEILEIMCGIAGLLAFIGLIFMHCFEKQWQKNIESKLRDLTIRLESYQLHVKGDIQIWTEKADHTKKKFDAHEEVYIHHQSKIIERLTELEDKNKHD